MHTKSFQIGSFWQNKPTLDQALDGSGNLFTPIRLILALGVLLGHSFVVNTGPGVPEPLSLFGMTLSYVSVNGFFILSGLLITRSIDRNPDFIRFFAARFLRIYPAVAVMVLLAVFLFGPMITPLSIGAVLVEPQNWRFICDVLSFGDTTGGPAQIFAGNPWEGEWSAALWTLRYEVIAYSGTFLLAFLGWNRSRTLILALFVSSVSLFVLLRMDLFEVPNPLIHLSRFAVPYLLGAVLYNYRKQVHLSWALGAIICGVALLFGPTAAFEIWLNFVLAAGILLIGFAKIPGASWLSKMPDYSYGVYIWQWPVMQALWYFDLARDPLITMMMAIPVSIGLGALSWYLLEKPVLALKNPFATWLHQHLTVRKIA